MRLFSRMAGVMQNYTINLRNWKGIVLVLGVAIIFSGCGTTNTMGRKLDDSSVKQIKIGMTTKSEVIQLIGDPSRRGVTYDTERWFYSYQENSRSSAVVIPFTGTLVGGKGNNSLSQSIAIEFKGDVVAKCSYTKSTGSVNLSGSGLSGIGATTAGNNITTDCEKAE